MLEWFALWIQWSEVISQWNLYFEHLVIFGHLFSMKVYALCLSVHECLQFISNSIKPSIPLLSTNKLRSLRFTVAQHLKLHFQTSKEITTIIPLFISLLWLVTLIISHSGFHQCIYESVEQWICQTLPPKCLLNAVFTKGQVPRITWCRRLYFQRFQLTYQELGESALAKTTSLYCDRVKPVRWRSYQGSSMCSLQMFSNYRSGQPDHSLFMYIVHFIFNTPWKFH